MQKCDTKYSWNNMNYYVEHNMIDQGICANVYKSEP